jgi:thiamine-monophosphate kinase
MAGRPRYLTVALTLPATCPDLEQSLEQFYLGFTQCARAFGADIVGGDLTVGPHFVVNVTAIGESHESGLLLRSGAQPGDVVVVTGTFGSSAAGLELLLQGDSVSSREGREELLRAHLEPQPRLAEALALVCLVGSRGALMDASDGLGDALWQIAEQSQVDIEVDLEAIPRSTPMSSFAHARGVNPYQWALYGGEDYELVGTMSEGDWLKAQSLAGESFPFKKIGVVLATSPTPAGSELEGDRVRLLASGDSSGTFSGVVNLSNCFKHF